jgi:hypothetical protein
MFNTKITIIVVESQTKKKKPQEWVELQSCKVLMVKLNYYQLVTNLRQYNNSIP